MTDQVVEGRDAEELRDFCHAEAINELLGWHLRHELLEGTQAFIGEDSIDLIGSSGLFLCR